MVRKARRPARARRRWAPPKIAKIHRWRILGVGIRRKKPSLVFGALGLGGIYRGIRRVHLPQTTVVPPYLRK